MSSASSAVKVTASVRTALLKSLTFDIFILAAAGEDLSGLKSRGAFVGF